MFDQLRFSLSTCFSFSFWNGRIERSDDRTKASVFVLNTCSIRDHAEQKVYSYVGPYAIRKQKGENIAIVVAG